MSPSGDADLPVRTRRALLDALVALDEHRNSVVVVGAQAVYLHTGGTKLAIAEATKDSDLAVDPRALDDEPLLEAAMQEAGFKLDPDKRQPGAWVSPDGIPVDLMVPESLGNARGKRGARIPPHDKNALRQARGIEATVASNSKVTVTALTEDDNRSYRANVAGPGALIVAKLFKLQDRQGDPNRLFDKDAHDIFRLLTTIDSPVLSAELQMLRVDDLAGGSTRVALDSLDELFGAGPDAPGSVMAGRAEEGIGEPAITSASVAALAADLLDALDPKQS